MNRNLNTLLNDFEFEALPAAWSTFDLARFSRTKRLWDYQQAALQNALKALWKYYDDSLDYQPFEVAAAAAERKRRFFEWYRLNDLPLEARMNINSARKRDLVHLLQPYFAVEDDSIDYTHLINRMGFWMATGSGKTLVLVRLIELLWELMRREEIPARDVLVLTCREDLLEQLRTLVADYNTGSGPLHLRLRELKEFPQSKFENPSLLAHQELTVFYYRSDNLSDEQKERIIDFRNYDNNGRWYLLLDEAHKGDKEDSKRQHIYNILARDGFLFNFSATFTDPRDILTTAAEFNLSSFIGAGYGKHLSLFQQEIRAFRPREDYSSEEKQRVVLKSLLMLAYAAIAREKMVAACERGLYHRPLMLALVNSVNTEDADLKLFFNELARIASQGVSAETLARAKRELREDLTAGISLLYEDDKLPVSWDIFEKLDMPAVLKYVFNAPGPGQIEVITRRSNDKELGFKLVNSDSPFALIRIGNTADWYNNFLNGYISTRAFEIESYFERLNDDESEINLLMGSRSFYEGWDSNRPNVINFINIGVGEDAKKFILQAVGRGVRIEPLSGQRKRMQSLYNAHVKGVDLHLFNQAKPYLPAVETLFIFGTNRLALEVVLSELKQQSSAQSGETLELKRNDAALDGKTVLVPTYRPAKQALFDQRDGRKFELHPAEQANLQHYVDWMGDDRLLLAVHDLQPAQVERIRHSLAKPDEYFNPAAERRFGNVNILIPRLTRYFSTIPQEFAAFKPLEEEIRHFRHIRVELKDIESLCEKIDKVANYEKPEFTMAELFQKVALGELSADKAAEAAHAYQHGSAAEEFTPPGGITLHIKHVAEHYYLPLLVAEDEKIDYIQHVIRVASERKFIEKLEAALKDGDDPFKAYDWWLFSRTDESLDSVGLPYYDPKQNRIRDFHPDFVFWMQKGDDYRIVFIDPKGIQNVDYQYKVDGYRELFEDANTGALKVFQYGSKQVRVELYLFTADAGQVSEGYRKYWIDRVEKIGQG